MEENSKTSRMRRGRGEGRFCPFLTLPKPKSISSFMASLGSKVCLGESCTDVFEFWITALK